MEKTLFEYGDHDILLYCNGVKRVLARTRPFIKILSGDNMESLCSLGENAMFFYTHMNDRPESDSTAAEIYAWADYLTYIPYAEKGYRALEKKLAEQDLTVEEWRYKTFLKILGADAQKFGEAKLENIKEFFYAHTKPQAHVKSIEETAMLILRVQHCLETVNAAGTPWNDDGEKFDADLDDLLCDVLVDMDAVADVEEILAKYAAPTPPLGDKEREFAEATPERINSLL